MVFWVGGVGWQVLFGRAGLCFSYKRLKKILGAFVPVRALAFLSIFLLLLASHLLALVFLVLRLLVAVVAAPVLPGAE